MKYSSVNHIIKLADWKQGSKEKYVTNEVNVKTSIKYTIIFFLVFLEKKFLFNYQISSLRLHIFQP